jgi:hypothetical protein
MTALCNIIKDKITEPQTGFLNRNQTALQCNPTRANSPHPLGNRPGIWPAKSHAGEIG